MNQQNSAQPSHPHLTRWPAVVKVLIPVAVAVAIPLCFADFFWFALNANLVLNSMILAVLALGVVLVVLRAREVDREGDLLVRVLRHVGSGRHYTEKLGHTPLATAFARLCADESVPAGHLPRAAIDSELVLVREQFDLRQEPAQYLVGMMVGLGLLGTFIGLLDTLTRATEVLRLIGTADAKGGEGALESVFVQMVGALEGPLASMGTAFSASMFGLVGSLVIGLMVVILRRATNELLGRARTGMFALAQPEDATPGGASSQVGGWGPEVVADFVRAMAEQNERMNCFNEESARQMTQRFEGNEALLAQVSEAVSSLQVSVGQVSASVQLLSDRMDRQSSALSDLPKSLEMLGQWPAVAEAGNRRLEAIQALLHAQEGALVSLSARLQSQHLERAEFGRHSQETSAQAVQLLEEIAHGLTSGLGRVHERQEQQWLACNTQMDLLRRALMNLETQQAKGLTGQEAHRSLLQAGLDQDAARTAWQRVVGDAVIAVNQGIEGMGQKVNALLHNQREVLDHLQDVSGGLRATLSRVELVAIQQEHQSRMAKSQAS